MKKDDKHFTIRVDEELLRKFRYVAKEDGRSINKELLCLMRDNIEEFEAEHGEIPVRDEDM